MSKVKEEESIYFTDLILFLAKNLKLFIILPLILSLLTIINIIYFTESVFTSTAKIMSSGAKNNTSGLSGLATQFGVNFPIAEGTLNRVYPEIIKSRIIADKVLNREFITKKYKEGFSLYKILLSLPGSKSDFFLDQKRKTLIIEKFLEMIEVSENRKTSMLLSLNYQQILRIQL